MKTPIPMPNREQLSRRKFLKTAALAGGVTMILAMPNTKPPIFDNSTLELALDAAKQKARCDYAQFVGAGPDNADILPSLAPKATGLKMYLDSTFGELRLNDMTLWMPHFEKFPKDYPIVLHSESRTMAAGILFAAIYDRLLPSIGVTPLSEPAGVVSNYYKYIAMPPSGVDRTALKKHLRSAYDVGLSGEVYEAPCHLQPVFGPLAAGTLPVAEELCARHICMPVSAVMTDEDAEYTVESLGKALAEVRVAVEAS